MSTQTKAPEVQTISSERGTEYLREVLTLAVEVTTRPKVSSPMALGLPSPVRGRLQLATDHKLRIMIKLDPYAIQCYARIARWDGSQWHSLHEIHYAHMATPSCSKRGATNFNADRSELLRVAAEVLA